MSKMKHLLRKLHIGGGGGGFHDQHSRLPPGTGNPSAELPRPNRTAPFPPSSTSTSSSTSSSTVTRSGGAVDSVESSDADFGFFEEEFQMQLALAISVSSGVEASRADAETAQIKAAKEISLGCVPSESFVEFLSLRYWNNNVVNYDERVMDGFYDVYGITSSSIIQGKMPQLVDLEAVSVSDEVDYEVILVNRTADKDLRWLEERVSSISLDSKALDVGCQTTCRLIQKMADVVVCKMGGPVSDADEMLRSWNRRSYQLRTSLNSIVLPLGRLDVGLSQHRALLFKVLADKINLPCSLVKGSYYTGTDDGAVNLIKVDDGSEYIIDLMGAPGTLIPAEVPACNLLNFGLDIRNAAEVAESFKFSSSNVEGRTDPMVVSPDLVGVSQTSSSNTEVACSLGNQPVGDNQSTFEISQTGRSDDEFGKLHLLLFSSREDLTGSAGKPSPAEVLPSVRLQRDSAVYNGDHSVTSSTSKDFVLGHGNTNEAIISADAGVPLLERKLMNGFAYEEVAKDLNGNLKSKESDVELVAQAKIGRPITCATLSEKSSLGEVEWEILWEDLKIGERIGIGSYGEVYRAEWKGTEVAVKKFMNQDLSGDAITHFKAEVEIMLRLRHPNVVLFMGAVTCPPNLSILTEFLPRGSLFKLLHRPNIQLDKKRRMRMALDVAKGMNHLHTSSPIIVHRDLKTPNLLVDKNLVVKVCDFGMSRMKHHTFLSSKSTAGTPEWMAPEVLRNEPSNEKSDVYSFGVILWELATLRVPWTEMNSMQVVGAVGFQHRNLDIPEDVDPVVAQLITDCWDPEPPSRPSFGQIISRLRHLRRLSVNRTETCANLQ